MIKLVLAHEGQRDDDVLATPLRAELEGLKISALQKRAKEAIQKYEEFEAQEKDITVRVEARADIVTNALIIGFVIALVIGVAYGSIKVSRR